MGLVKETLSSCRAILSGQEEVVHNGECVQLTMADAMEAMMAQSQLTIAAFGTGTGALKEVCAFAGHRLAEQPLLLWHQEQGTVRGLQRSEQGLGAFIQGMTVFSARCLVGHQLEVNGGNQLLVDSLFLRWGERERFDLGLDVENTQEFTSIEKWQS